MKESVTKNLFLIITILFLVSVTLWSQTIPRTLYSINGSAQTISKMNLETKEITQNILTTGEIPNGIISHNNMIYLVNSKPDNIMVIDPADDSVVKTIALTEGSNPWAMAFVNDTKAYVTNWLTDSVTIINVEEGTVVKSIAVGKAPEGIVVVGSKAYVVNTGYASWGNPYEQSTVTIIDTDADTILASVNIPTNGQDLALAPNGELHVVCSGDYSTEFGKIAVINIEAEIPIVTDTIDIGGTPGDIEISSDGTGFCSAWGDGINGHIYQYNANTNTVIRNSDDPILVGPNLSGLFWDEVANSLWIPYMTEWGGDGFAQQFSVNADSVVWTSSILGNGTSAFAIVEEFVVSVENDDDNSLIEQFNLSQNYPNPFNPTTTINYQLPNSNFVTLKIYDVLGNEITTLVNENKQAGVHTINFDGSNLSSGIYYIQFNSNGFRQTRKMMLMK
ncbi:MAG: T9SS type A sorting domain-containing protein [Ignavibacteriae bacterium]|nr:T9SS type A sorting domain-containing protein [Ignavibacteriota bacterium]